LLPSVTTMESSSGLSVVRTTLEYSTIP